MNDLAKRIEALGDKGDNSLDVQVEIALFRPGTCYSAIRSNAAGTKVIYTNVAGNDVTCWAEDWTGQSRRAATITALALEGDRP